MNHPLNTVKSIFQYLDKPRFTTWGFAYIEFIMLAIIIGLLIFKLG